MYKPIQERFESNVKNHFGWSTYLCFASAITAQDLSEVHLVRWFNRLVDKDDYEPSEKKSIITHLMKLTREPAEVVLPENQLGLD